MSNFFSSKLDSSEIKRFDRQMRLPGWNQGVLKTASVLIAGVGGLGCEIAKNLAMAGVGTLHLVDMDTIEYSNLNRQLLFFNAKEGTPKSEAASKMLKKLNPYSTYISHFSALEDLDPIIFKEVDVLISGLDSVQARSQLNRRAVQFSKPLVDGGTTTYYGHIYSYIPEQNACLSCDPLRERETEDLAACTLVGIPRKPVHCLLKGQLFFESQNNRLPNPNNRDEVKIVLRYANKLIMEHFPQLDTFSEDDVVHSIDHRDPAIITVNAVIASLQSQDIIRIIHHLRDVNLGAWPLEYTIYNGLSSKFYQFSRPRKNDCSSCGSSAPEILRFELPITTTIDTILRILENRGYQIDPEIPPSVWRMDVKNMELIETESSLKDLKIKNYETLMFTGISSESDKTTLYIQIKIRK